METYEFRTSFAYAISVFVLVSCLYGRHIRSKRLFTWTVLLFVAAIVIYEWMMSLQPISGGFGGGGSFATQKPLRPRSAIFDAIASFSLWAMYGTLPLFYIACRGSDKAYAQCSRCGYNLTQNTSGVCPECGATLG